jgi:hypothetical protein
MVTLQISFDNLWDAIDHLPEEQKQILLQRLSSGMKKNANSTSPKKRVAGLGEGRVKMSDDFIDPLPDDFWFGEDK